MKVEIQLHEDDPGSIKIVHTKDNLGKRSIMTITYDNSVKLSPEELQKNYEENQHRLEAITSYHKQKSHSKAKKILREHVLESLDTKYPYLFITLTYGNKTNGRNKDEALRDILNIRRRFQSLFFPSFRPKKNAHTDKVPRPERCPRMFFFLEKHADGQYHIHLLIEWNLHPEILAHARTRTPFIHAWNSIVGKITHRDHEDQLVISDEMVHRYKGYESHKHYGKTFDNLGVDDPWLMSRFLCEFFASDDLGLKKISNSPKNIHSKVIENNHELITKAGSYLNKDQYFDRESINYLDHVVPEYSDYSN